MTVRPWAAFAGLFLAAVSLFVTPAAAQKREAFARSYPGVITLEVDATDVEHRILRVRETIPARPGRMRLHFPQWLPGWHSAQASRIWLVSGLAFEAGGNRLAWTRDPHDVHTFTIEVPKGATEVAVDFQYLTPLSAAQGPFIVADDAATLAWNNVVLYPASVTVDAIRVRPSLKLPPSWELATSLEIVAQVGDTTQFEPVSLATLVDSPVFAGRYVRKLDLASSGPPVTLNLVGESNGVLAAQPAHVGAFREMVTQAYGIFGPPPYKRFEFLVALHEHITHASFICLEHQSSAELPRPPTLFTKWDATPGDRNVIAHEFIHAWVGKKHRPAGLLVENFNMPAAHGMLWSYEGETSYWAYVLETRSGLTPRDFVMQNWMRLAAVYSTRAGRSWRGLEDSGNEPAMRLDRARDWVSWQRTVDHYGEGPLLWLETDATIRRLTDERKSLDDFARAFHGAAAPAEGVVPYTFEDIVRALNQVAPYDWRRFLRERLAPGARDPGAAAFEAAGWRIVYREAQAPLLAAMDREAGSVDTVHSIGILVNRQGALTAVIWDSPAFKAGLASGTTLVSVNGTAYTPELLMAAITEAKDSARPIVLRVKRDGRERDVSIDYRGGLRYPHLERIAGVPDRLAAILEPRR